PMNVTGVLGAPLGGGPAAQDHIDGRCDILNLSLGPIDLNLLGVTVSLDDCAGGPVTVDVTGDPEGGLLGDLLGNLADGINLRGVDLGRLAGRVDRLIDRLTDLADRLDQLDLGNLTGRLERQIDHILDQIRRVAGRVDDLRDLDRFFDRLDHTIDRLDR